MSRLLALGLLCAAFTFAFPANAEIGTIKRVTGIVVVERGSRKLPAIAGFQLMQGDVIVTGANGSAGVTFVDLTRISVNPRSRILLSKFEFDRQRRAGQFVTQVDRGTLGVVSGAIAKSKRNAMKVRTPTQIIGVVGTFFVVEVP